MPDRKAYYGLITDTCLSKSHSKVDLNQVQCQLQHQLDKEPCMTYSLRLTLSAMVCFVSLTRCGITVEESQGGTV